MEESDGYFQQWYTSTGASLSNTQTHTEGGSHNSFPNGMQVHAPGRPQDADLAVTFTFADEIQS